VQLGIPERTLTATGVTGCIQYIDRFGNLVTNIPAADVEGKSCSVAVGTRLIPATQTYSDRKLGDIVALIGSHGWLEVAVNGGNAQSELQLGTGAPVQVLLA
jgi:hypothetical protein